MTLGVVGLAKIIWIVVIVVQSTKYKNTQNSEGDGFTQELVSFEDILNSFEEESATEEIIKGVLRDLGSEDFQAFVSHVNNQENRLDKIVGALAAHVDRINPQTQLSRSFVIELLRKIDSQHAPALLERIGAPQADGEYAVYARFPELMAIRVTDYSAKQIVGIYNQIEAARKDAFKEALRTHLGTLSQAVFASFVAKFNDEVSQASQPILDLIASYPDKLDLIENLSESLRLNLVTHFVTEKGVGLVLLKSVVTKEEIKTLSLELEGDRSYRFLVALVDLVQTRDIAEDLKTRALVCIKNIFKKFNLNLKPKELSETDRTMISLFALFPSSLAQWHYTYNIGLYPPFLELFYKAMHDEGQGEYREVVSKIQGEDQLDALARFFNAALITEEIDLTSSFSKILFSHPLALAKISCEIWGTKTSLSRLQQLRRVDGGESSQNYFEILYKLNAESALGLAISDLQSILKERETTPNLGLEAIPLVKWLVLRRGALVGIASSIEQSALPCLRMLTLEDIGLNSGVIGYFKDLYNARKEIAAREIGAHLVAIVDEQGKDPALDISKKPIIQWFIATPSVFKDVFATDKLFKVETKTRIVLV